MEFIAAIILGVVLGISEFLPVSSVGHSLVLSSLLAFPPTKAMRDTFAVFIEGGALLAVMLFYSRDLWKQARQLSTDKTVRHLWLNVIIAFVPVGIVGFLFHDWVEQVLFSPVVVGISLILGGVAFLVVERRHQPPRTVAIADMSTRQALWVGIAQILALIPGVSRSGATIIGGLLVGLDRQVATVFTFYLFIPTLAAASGYELLNAVLKGTIDSAYLPYFLLAAAVGFCVSLVAMRWLLGYIRNHDFQIFGIYRIIVGVIVIGLVLLGVLR
jgi:undecaprenyl-diphosphatase